MTPEPRFHMGRCRRCGRGWNQVWHRDRGWECRGCWSGRAVRAIFDDLIVPAILPSTEVVVPASAIEHFRRLEREGRLREA